MLNATIHSAKGDGSQSFIRQGSLRRVLPTEHNKENIFGSKNEDINQFYKIVQQEYIILAEYKMLISENIQSIYVIPSKENSLVWFGVIFVRSGLYEDGIFRFNIILSENFPHSEHPKVIFQSEIYHPVINIDTKELPLTSAFQVWNKDEQHIWQVVKYIHWIFYNFEDSITHSINQEVLNVYRNNPTAFKEKVKDCVKLSNDCLYDPAPVDDKHYIIFEKYIPEIHDPVQASMISENNEDHSIKMGHSWVMPGSFKPLSRVPSTNLENDS